VAEHQSKKLISRCNSIPFEGLDICYPSFIAITLFSFQQRKNSLKSVIRFDFNHIPITQGILGMIPDVLLYQLELFLEFRILFIEVSNNY
jgi:hypothetical protein